MIKTDFKPQRAGKSIFSSNRKRTAIPVIIIATVALLLAVWGLWSEMTPQPDTNNGPDNSRNDTLLSDENNTSNDTDFSNKRQEIQLDFQHDKKTDESDTSNEKQNKKKNIKAEKQIKTPEQVNNQPDKRFIWQKTKIRSGDSMAKVFQRLKFSPGDLHSIITLGKETSILKKIKPGKILQYSKQTDGKLNAIRYPIDQLNTLTVTKTKNHWNSVIDTKELEIRLTNTRGTINNSLFIAGKRAGLTDALVMDLAGIFGWDIDFILDIREGDDFTVIYEEKYVQGEKIGNGNILAAEFTNQNKTYRAVRYTDSTGHSEYFTPAGMSMRKAFLRAPVDFSYISSNFNPRRYHPILKRVKAHNGIDYRAPKGTPVKAAGDGKVIKSAYSKYNGHHVFIQHGQKYVTKYLHFTKRKVRRGQKVKQGQVIGYVGSTGLAQAPHLHYEFLVNGVHRNPRTIKLPDAKPINKKEKTKFLSMTRTLVKQLDTQKHIYTELPITAD